LAVDDALSSVGASVTRTPVGDVYVAERARDPDVVFGGEPSGAWIWPDETLCPDGPLAAVVLAGLVAAEGSLSSLAAEIPDYPIERASVAVAGAEKSCVIDAVSEDIRATYDDVSTMDGVRVAVDDGWFLVRASGTQPLLRLTSQARSVDRAAELLGAAESLVERHI
jgi:phosphoglucosamine mutase